MNINLGENLRQTEEAARQKRMVREEADRQERIAKEEARRQWEAEHPEEARKEQKEKEVAAKKAQEAVASEVRRKERASNNRRNEFVFLSGSFQWDGENWMVIWFPLLAGFHWSPVPFTCIGFEPRIGLAGEAGYLSLAPTLGLIIPFNKRVALFTDAVLDMGFFGKWNGLITDGITPGFDFGLKYKYYVGNDTMFF